MFASKNTSSVSVPLKWTNSIFIPAIDFSITKNQIKDFMEKKIGKVSRIDFVSFNSDNGSGRRVFVHFSEWYNTDYAKFVRSNIQTNSFYDLLMPLSNNPNYNIRLLMNKNPVPETEQTIQQVASNVDFMAEKIRIQEEEILSLKQLCENLFHSFKNVESKMNTLLLEKKNNYVQDDVMGQMNISEL